MERPHVNLIRNAIVASFITAGAGLSGYSFYDHAQANSQWDKINERQQAVSRELSPEDVEDIPTLDELEILLTEVENIGKETDSLQGRYNWDKGLGIVGAMSWGLGGAGILIINIKGSKD